MPASWQSLVAISKSNTIITKTMRKTTQFLLTLGLAASPLLLQAQSEFSLQQQTLANPDNEPAPVHPVPHERQMQWQETEFYAFFHYGMNTYTGKEWGYGDENRATFAPTAAPNPRQWLEAVKAAGMKGGIAVVKHHDGFCLWPTETTDHNVTNSGNEFGRNTNIPRDFAAAAKDLGMKYGFYISPWDRNSAYYGDGTNRYVKDVFLRQCTELVQYGDDQFEMWFDGANGGDGYYGGANTTRSIDNSTYYDIPNLRDSVHKVMPNCVMWGVGGEARWIGNEAGWAGETNWSPRNRGAEKGRAENGEEDGWYWLPGESDAKATGGGWFWHSDGDCKTADQLFKFYLKTVGRNATLILNFPPNKAGILPDTYVAKLKELGQMLQTRLGTDLAPNAKVEVTTTRAAGANRTYEAAHLIDNNKDTYWATDDGVNTATITLTWDETQTIHYVTLMEYIRKGQRVKGFTVETSADGNTWTQRASGTELTTIGYKRIVPLNGSTSSYGNGYKVKAVRITITDSKACPLIHTVSVY